MTCADCQLWARVSPRLHPRGFCGTLPIPTEDSGLCAHEIALGIMRSRPKWTQGDCCLADTCPKFIRKGAKK